MAEAPSGGGEKTEAATQKRLQDSGKKGDVLQSKELGAALVVLAGAAAFTFLGADLMRASSAMLSDGLTLNATDIQDFNPAAQTVRLLSAIIIPFFALFGITIAAAIATPILLGSLGFRWSAMKPKAEKLSPLKGLKRMFGTHGLIELGKSLAKVILLSVIGLSLVYESLPDMFSLGRQDIGLAASHFGDLFLVVMLTMTAGFFLIAGIDVPSQMFQRGKRLKMTKQEVKDEHKEVEGSPEAKAALRQRQHETLSRSARKAMDEATVILNNPTHFSVIIRYRPGRDAVPVVLARGRDAAALAIRELAEAKSVPMLQYPELTRAIYFTTPDGKAIDERLYVAVATVLAFLFRLDAQIADQLDRPFVDIPKEMRFDMDGKLNASD